MLDSERRDSRTTSNGFTADFHDTQPISRETSPWRQMSAPSHTSHCIPKKLARCLFGNVFQHARQHRGEPNGGTTELPLHEQRRDSELVSDPGPGARPSSGSSRVPWAPRCSWPSPCPTRAAPGITASRPGELRQKGTPSEDGGYFVPYS